MFFDGFDLSDRVLCSFHLVCYIANSFSDVCFSTNTNSFINVTSWMNTWIFKFKKSIRFPSELFYSDVIFIISKFIKLFDKLFRSNFIFITI